VTRRVSKRSSGPPCRWLLLLLAPRSQVSSFGSPVTRTTQSWFCDHTSLLLVRKYVLYCCVSLVWFRFNLQLVNGRTNAPSEKRTGLGSHTVTIAKNASRSVDDDSFPATDTSVRSPFPSLPLYIRARRRPVTSHKKAPSVSNN
jgi:hypothetical protein